MATRDIEALAALGLPDHVVHSEAIPWVPQGERVWFKPLRFDLTSGRWVNLLKVVGNGKVNRHRHTGGQVLGYCMEGQWRYLEREWVARPGSFIYEPPGDIHTLVVDGDAGMMVTLFILEGVVQYLDDDDLIVSQDDAFAKLQRYLAHCRQEGIEPLDLCF